ncbi:MAG: DUF2799 domain-containing protein [Gammaproteobacteria bacterium]|nr:DUF2799 domain-containing protein [Gammaproteobacteria bacterium]
MCPGSATSFDVRSLLQWAQRSGLAELLREVSGGIRPAARGLSVLAGASGLALAMALHGCATLSEADCVSADWAVMGEADGQLGRPISDLNRYRRDCAEHGVVPDGEAYLAGRQRGLAVFCTEANGYREGRSGASGDPVCPPDLEPGFRHGYGLGRAVHDALTELRASGDAIDSSRDRIEQLEADISDREADLRSDELGEDERRRLRDEIGSMKREVDRLEREVAVLIGTIAVLIAHYRAAVEAARVGGYDEPMETETILALGRLMR